MIKKSLISVGSIPTFAVVFLRTKIPFVSKKSSPLIRLGFYFGEKMDIKDVIDQVKEIKEAQLDPEVAHLLEDNLYEQVLNEIAFGNCSNPKTFAKEALKTKNISFSRWYA